MYLRICHIKFLVKTKNWNFKRHRLFYDMIVIKNIQFHNRKILMSTYLDRNSFIVNFDFSCGKYLIHSKTAKAQSLLVLTRSRRLKMHLQFNVKLITCCTVQCTVYVYTTSVLFYLANISICDRGKLSVLYLWRLNDISWGTMSRKLCGISLLSLSKISTPQCACRDNW